MRLISSHTTKPVVKYKIKVISNQSINQSNGIDLRFNIFDHLFLLFFFVEKNSDDSEVVAKWK